MAYLMTPLAHAFFHPGKKTSIFFFQTMGFWWQDSTPNPNNAVIVRNPFMHIYILGDANSSHRKKKKKTIKNGAAQGAQQNPRPNNPWPFSIFPQGRPEATFFSKCCCKSHHEHVFWLNPPFFIKRPQLPMRIFFVRDIPCDLHTKNTLRLASASTGLSWRMVDKLRQDSSLLKDGRPGFSRFFFCVRCQGVHLISRFFLLNKETSGKWWSCLTEQRETNPVDIPLNPGWLIGSLIMAYSNPYTTG